MCSVAFLPLTGEDKNIKTSINLTMCFSFKQQQAEKKNMSRYLYNIGVAPNSGHKDRLHSETVKIQNIFRYKGKKYKDSAVINNNCYRLIVNSQVKCYLKGQFTQK